MLYNDFIMFNVVTDKAKILLTVVTEKRSAMMQGGLLGCWFRLLLSSQKLLIVPG